MTSRKKTWRSSGSILISSHMKLRVGNKEIPLLIVAFTAILLVVSSTALTTARSVVADVVLYCKQMFVLVGTQVPSARVWALIVMIVLVSGVIYAVWGFLIGQLKTRRLVTRAISGSNLIKTNNTEIHITDESSILAWTSGIFRPRIFISRMVLDRFSKEEFSALVQHELSHIKHRDILKRLLLDFVGRMFFYVPSLVDINNAARFGQEVRADIEAIGSTSRQAICSLYLSSAGLNKEKGATVTTFAFSSKRLSAVLSAGESTFELSTKRLMVSGLVLLLLIVPGLFGINIPTSHAADTVQINCEVLQSLEERNFTSIIGSLELYTPMK